MSIETRPLDPEIQAILTEVACDPRAHLLRVPELRVPLAYEAPVGDRAPGLTAAERQIASVHRADVAQLLLDAVQRDLYLRPTREFVMHHEVTVDRRIELADERAWQDRARRVVERSRVAPIESDATALLAACVQHQAARAPSAVALAVASLRLVPCDETRIYLALALRREKQFSTARKVLLGIVGDRPSHLNLSCAWDEIGNCAWDLGDTKAAREAYEASAATRAERGLPLMNHFALCVDLGDAATASRVARQLQDMLDSEHDSVTEYVEFQRARGGRRSWDRPGGGLPSALVDSLPSTARRIAHALE